MRLFAMPLWVGAGGGTGVVVVRVDNVVRADAMVAVRVVVAIHLSKVEITYKILSRDDAWYDRFYKEEAVWRSRKARQKRLM